MLQTDSFKCIRMPSRIFPTLDKARGSNIYTKLCIILVVTRKTTTKYTFSDNIHPEGDNIHPEGDNIHPDGDRQYKPAW